MDRRFVPIGPPSVSSRQPLPPAPPPGVRADALSPDEKRRVWAHIKQHDPNLLAFCTDPTVKAFVERTPGASIFFPKTLVETALGAIHKATKP